MKVKEIPVSLFSASKLSMATSKKLNDDRPTLPVIVSLASIPSRLSIVHLTIRSLLLQNKRPKKIILWLHKDLAAQIPKRLSKLCSDFFEIHYSELTCPHRKLINTLKILPKEVIVTCDDDMIYRHDWLVKLYEEHIEHPEFVIANQTRCISYDEDGDLLSYDKWESKKNQCKNRDAVLPIGAGGTLYPTNSLHKDVFNEKLYLKLAPRADDLWFKAMTIKSDTKSKQSQNSNNGPIPIFGSQKESLKKSNVSKDKNRVQWQSIADYYDLHDKIRGG